MIELELWNPTIDAGKLQYAGMKTAYEVFLELRTHLESIGYLPDKYFLLAERWRDGADIPKHAGIFNTVDYGGSEGIYLDIYFKWHEDGKPVTENFITGKTLGESRIDMDRMHLISSAVTQAFHTDGVHARFMKTGVDATPEGVILGLNTTETEQLISSLLDARQYQSIADSSCKESDLLLRKVTGSADAFMQVVGHMENLNAEDKAVLAISANNLTRFESLLPAVENNYTDLLIRAAGQPGRVGRSMMETLMDKVQSMDVYQYEEVCQQAVKIGDTDRVLYLLDRAKDMVKDCPIKFNAEIMSYSMQRHGEFRPGTKMDRAIFHHCDPAQQRAISSKLVERAFGYGDHALVFEMLQGGAALAPDTSEVLYQMADKAPWMLDHLEKWDVKLSDDNYGPLRRCLFRENEIAMNYLVEYGADFEAFYQIMSAEVLEPEAKEHPETQHVKFCPPEQAGEAIPTLTT